MPSNSSLYDRIARIQIFATVQTDAGPSGKGIQTLSVAKTYSSKQDDGSPGFRIKFNVQLVTGNVPHPSPAIISIYNLDVSSRKIFEQLNNTIVLQAGYGKNAKTIFAGQIQYGNTRKEGPDYVTEIHAADGQFAFQNSMINTNFGQPTPAIAVINALVQNLASAGITTGTILGLPSSTYNNGVVLTGKTTDRIKEFCETNNLNWAIDKGKINIVPYGSALPGLPILLSEDSGLIGIPEQREKDITGATLISFKSLMNPEITRFAIIALQSKFINGPFVALRITNVGDTFGNDWYTEVEASAMKVGL